MIKVGPLPRVCCPVDIRCLLVIQYNTRTPYPTHELRISMYSTYGIGSAFSYYERFTQFVQHPKKEGRVIVTGRISVLFQTGKLQALTSPCSLIACAVSCRDNGSARPIASDRGEAPILGYRCRFGFASSSAPFVRRITVLAFNFS